MNPKSETHSDSRPSDRTTDRPDTVSEYWSRDQLSEYYGIQAIGITKQFDGVKALDDVSLTIPIFGMTSIVGPNGSGKSTLVNLLTGVLPYDDGIVMIETNAFKSSMPTRHQTTASRAPSKRFASSIK